MAKKVAQNTETKENSKSVAKNNPITDFIAYVENARAELRKVTWPTLKETRSATFVVLGFVTVMAILLSLVDLGLSTIIKTILS